MTITIRKIASLSQVPGDPGTTSPQDTDEYTGELLSPLMEGHPVLVAYWRRREENACGIFSTSELTARGPTTLCTTDGIFAVRFPDTEMRRGRARIAALRPTGNGKLLRVPFRWKNTARLRERFLAALGDSYTLELESLPFAKSTGFVEKISAGVQQAIVEAASRDDLEEVEARMRTHYRAMSGGVARCWCGLADIDLRGEFVVIPSEVRVQLPGDSVQSIGFVSVVEPDQGRILHLTREEFPLDVQFETDWRQFWRRLQEARKQGEL